MTRDCSLNSKKNTIVFLFFIDIQNNICTQQMYFSWNSMNNLSSYCGLTDSKVRASEEDLPVNGRLLQYLPTNPPNYSP